MDTAALIFDFDGVIVHSEPLHFLAIRDTFAAAGYQFDEAVYYTKYVSYADRDLFPIIARDAQMELSPSRLEAMLEDKWLRFASLVQSHGVHVLDATVALIKGAHAQGVTVALCTAAMRRDVDLILGSLDVLPIFHTVVSAGDVAKSKPDPAPYALACQRLGLPPASCVALEDTPGGIASARGAGLRVIGVAHSVAPDRLSAANLVVSSSKQLTVDRMLACR
jgi:beta-phosphoglucomutase